MVSYPDMSNDPSFLSNTPQTEVKSLSYYSQLSPRGNPAIMDTPIIRTQAAKSQAKTNYRRLTEINPRYYGLSLMRTPTRGPYSVRYKWS